MEQLQRGLRGKLILISASAGSGKTTLVTSFLNELVDHEKEYKIAWLSLDREDNEPVSFFTYLITALDSLDPKIGQAVRPFLEFPGILDIKGLMTILLNSLSTLSGKNILVIDDYHVIDQGELHQAMAGFIEHLPQHLRLILATREDPPRLPLHRYRAHGEVTEIRLQDIRFTHEEVAAFLQQTMGLSLDATATKLLGEYTEGWIAGLQMIALTLRGPAGIANLSTALREGTIPEEGRNHLIQYFGSEVLRQQRPEVRRFLQQTSILDRFNASLCEAITGRADGKAMIEELERANLFLIPLDHDGRWFRYHHLFANLLSGELSETERNELHRRASRWYEASEMTSEAIRHALFAQDWPEALRLIRAKVDNLVNEGEYATIAAFVHSFPEKIIRMHCDLLVCKGWLCCVRGDLAAAEFYEILALDRLGDDFTTQNQLLLLSFQACLALELGKAEDAARFAQRSLELHDDPRSFTAATALIYLGQAQCLLGDEKAARATYEKTISVCRELNIHSIHLKTISLLALLMGQLGNLKEAIRLCEETLSSLKKDQENPPPMAASIYMVLGILYYETNQLDQARNHLSISMSWLKAIGFLHRGSVAQYTLAMVYEALGDREAMTGVLHGFEESVSGFTNLEARRLFTLLLAESHIQRGQLAAADHLLTVRASLQSDISWKENLILVRLHLAQNKIEDALSLLDVLERSARKQQRVGDLITILLLKARACKHSGGAAQALEWVEEAIRLAAPEGYVRRFIDEGPDLISLLKQRKHVDASFVSEVLQGASTSLSPSMDDEPSLPLLSMPDPLSKTQLKVLHLLIQGLSNREIAATLQITEGTAKWHLNQIYSKLEVKSRSQAIAKAHEIGFPRSLSD